MGKLRIVRRFWGVLSLSQYLEAKLRNSRHYKMEDALSQEVVIQLMKEKFKSVDFEKAKQDVSPFIRIVSLPLLNEWSSSLFEALVETLNGK